MEAGNLLDFEWDDKEFTFGVEEPEKKETKPETKEEEKPEVPVEEQEEEQEENFEFDTDKSLEKVTPKVTEYQQTFNSFKEAGIFKHVEIDPDEELDQDRFLELQEEEYESEVSQRLQAWASQDLDEDAKAFIKFKRDGGRTEDFFDVYTSSSSIPEGDIKDEDYQDDIIRYQLTQEGWDKDEIEDRLEYLTDSNKKAKVAEKYEEKLKTIKNSQKEALLKQQETQLANYKKQENDFKNDIKSTLTSSSNIKGINITPTDKTKLLNFITKRDQKIEGDRYITSFQKKLNEAFQDKEKVVLLAKLLENDFDFSDIEEKGKTKQTRKVKETFEQHRNLKGSGSSPTGSLADLFD